MTAPVGNMYANWTAPDGTVWPLTDTDEDRGYFTTREVSGWGSTTYEFATDPLVRGGETVRFIRTNPARITWPLYVYGDTHQQFVDRYRALRRAFLMTLHRRQPGVLSVSRPDGTARTIEAYCEDGWGGEGEHHLFAKPVLTLYCPEGFWRDAEAVSVPRAFGSTASFLSPFPTISSSQLLGATTIDNPGDVDAWPEWTITGPMSSLTATNSTVGRSFVLNYTLTAGQQITITTLQPSIRGPGGTNIVNSLNWPSAYLWGLYPGSNTVSFAVTGAGSGSTINLAFHPRYEGA